MKVVAISLGLVLAFILGDGVGTHILKNITVEEVNKCLKDGSRDTESKLQCINDKFN